jgi:hypothetical protein
MQFIDLELITYDIINHKDGVLNLRSRKLNDSHIIELLPIFSSLKKNIAIDLTKNNITDFAAILLISQLKNTRELMLENNELSDNFLSELSKHVWTHNIEISVSFRGDDAAQVIQLSDYSKVSQSDFTVLNRHFSDHLETIYQNPNFAKPLMVKFLLGCVKYWNNDYINDQSYQQVVARKILPGDYSINQKQANLFNVLVTVVKHAAEVERLISVYKGFIKNNETDAENLLLKEIGNLIATIVQEESVDREYYDNYDFVCDIFEYFIKRYNDEIDNTLFFCTSPSWSDFIKNIREVFWGQIRGDRLINIDERQSDIHLCEKLKSRLIVTLHRDRYSRLLGYFSSYFSGRTKTLIEIDENISRLRNGEPAIVRIENVRNRRGNKHTFFQDQPVQALTQLLSAIRLHDRDRVAQLLTNPLLAQEIDTDFWSPIHHWAATSLVDREILTLLVAAKPDIIHDVIKTTGWNAVFVIINNCSGGYNVKVQKLDLLVQYGIDCCIKDELAGKLPIHYAVMSDEERIIEFLYKLKPVTLQITDNNNKTPRDYAPAGSVAETLLSYYHAPKGEEMITEWRVMI